MRTKCFLRFCELANKKTEQLYKVSTLCLEDHNFKKEELETVGELSRVCSQIVLKCLYLARIGGPYILWSVNKFARAVTQWTRACDRRLARFDSLQSSHEWPQTILSCKKHGSALSIGFIPRLRLCGRPWRLQINLEGNLVNVRKSNICSHKSDVQETNVSGAHFYRIGSFFLLVLDCEWMESLPRSDGCGDRSFAFFKEHPSSKERSLSKRKGRWSRVEHEWNPKHQPQHQIEMKQ